MLSVTSFIIAKPIRVKATFCVQEIVDDTMYDNLVKFLAICKMFLKCLYYLTFRFDIMQFALKLKYTLQIDAVSTCHVTVFYQLKLA